MVKPSANDSNLLLIKENNFGINLKFNLAANNGMNF